MVSDVVKTSNRGRKQLMLLAALFLAPVVTSWAVWTYLNNGGSVSPTNAGVLVQPARPLQQVLLQDAKGGPWSMESVRGRWAYVMFAASACADECDRQLYFTRQIRTGVSKDMGRVRRVLVLGYQPDEGWLREIAEKHPDLAVVVAEEGSWSQFAGQFGDQGRKVDGSEFFMVDPLGNLMMRYSSEVPANGIAKDLRKLLKVSQVG